MTPCVKSRSHGRADIAVSTSGRVGVARRAWPSAVTRDEIVQRGSRGKSRAERLGVRMTSENREGQSSEVTQQVVGYGEGGCRVLAEPHPYADDSAIRKVSYDAMSKAKSRSKSMGAVMSSGTGE